MRIRFAGRRHSIRNWIAPAVLMLIGGALAHGQDVFDNALGEGSTESESADAAASPDGNGLDGMGEEAATNGEEAVELTPQQQEIEQKFAQAGELMKQQQWSEAIPVFNEVFPLERFSTKPVAPQAFLGIGECFFNLKSYEQAISALSKATLAPGANTMSGLIGRATLLRGQAYLEMLRYREAMEDFGVVVQTEPENAEAYYNVGKASLRLVVSSPGGIDQGGQSQLLQGAQSLEQAIKLKPDYGAAYLERGRILFRLSDMDLAIEDLKKAVEFLGEASEASADLGIAVSRRAKEKTTLPTVNQEEVKADLQASIESLGNFLKTAELGKKIPPWETRDPLHMEPEAAMLALAESKIALGDELSGPEQTAVYREVIADCDKLLANELSDLDESRAHFTRGVALRMLNELRPALDSFTRSIERWPSQYGAYSEAYLRRGICLYHLGEDRAALQDFEAASTLASNPYDYEPRAMLWAGLALVRLGDSDGAIRSYTRAINSAPSFPMPYLNRGLAYLNSGRYNQALNDFNTLMRLEPNHPTVQSYRQLAQAHAN